MIVRSIYVIGATKNPVKIGVAADPKRRLMALQIGCPDLLVIHWSAMLPDGAVGSIESAVHTALAEHHRRGEWFNVDVETAVETITALAPGLVSENEYLARQRNAKSRDEVMNLVRESMVQPRTPATVHWYKLLHMNQQRLAAKVDAYVTKKAGISGMAALRAFGLGGSSFREVVGNSQPSIQGVRAALIKGLTALGDAEMLVAGVDEQYAARKLEESLLRSALTTA